VIHSFRKKEDEGEKHVLTSGEEEETVKRKKKRIGHESQVCILWETKKTLLKRG